jgi:hypothetical protein
VKETLRTLGPETNDAAEAEENDILWGGGKRDFFVHNIFSRVIKSRWLRL